MTNEIPPYRAPFYTELAAIPGWDFRVFTCTDREADRYWDVERKGLSFPIQRSRSLSYVRRSRHEGTESFEDVREVHLPVGLPLDLWRFRPDAIISAEFGARTLFAGLYARLFGSRLAVYFEGTPHTERNIGMSQRLVRRIIRLAPHAYAVNGRQGREYLQGLNVLPSSIVEIGQPLDTEAFTQEIGTERRSKLRAELGVEGQCYLFCGRLIPLKGLDQLLDAWEVFSKQNGVTATLLIFGEGSDRAHLEQRVAKAGLTNVRFLGHVQRDRLPEIYQAADVFVLPTLMDCWALVVNEAMASGLPVINSKFSGSSDLTVDSQTGWVIDPFDRGELLGALQQAWQSRDKLPLMRNSIRGAVASVSIPAVAARVRQLVDGMLAGKNPSQKNS